MTILTVSEAAAVLRVDATDPQMLNLLPLVDGYIRSSTGFDWTSLEEIPAQAKAAAQLLLVQWYDNPVDAGKTNSGGITLGFGLTGALAQLEALGLEYKVVEGLAGSGYIAVAGVKEGSSVVTATGLVGDSGDASAYFESYVTVDGYVRQIYTGNLDEKFYRLRIVPPERL